MKRPPSFFWLFEQCKQHTIINQGQNKHQCLPSTRFVGFLINSLEAAVLPLVVLQFAISFGPHML